MKFLSLRKLAMVSAVALSVAIGATHVQAQTTATVTTTFTTAAALASAFVTQLDFGTWAVNIDGGDTPQFAVTAIAGVPPVPVPSGVVDPNTFVVNTVAPAAAGEVTVTAPFVVNLQIAAVVNDFADPGILLRNPTYADTVDANVAIPAAFDGVTNVSVLAGGVAESVYIGAEIEFSATPAAATTFNDGTIDVSFNY